MLRKELVEKMIKYPILSENEKELLILRAVKAAGSISESELIERLDKHISPLKTAQIITLLKSRRDLTPIIYLQCNKKLNLAPSTSEIKEFLIAAGFLKDKDLSPK